MWGYLTLFLLFISFYLLLKIYTAFFQPLPTVKRNGPFKGKETPKGSYDVIIVGAGPAGSVMGHYLAKEGKKVALLEMKEFPRTKYCGDAWCESALRILEEMGILSQIEKDGKCQPVNRGGFVSPSGIECIGGPYGSTAKIRTYAIKRVIADQYIAEKAEESGARLIQNCKVENCVFDKEDEGGLWHVTSEDKQFFRGRVLICADGSNSFTARKLGLIPDTGATAVCSHQYVKGGTHNISKFGDGVIYYTKSLLPGYSAVFKHYNFLCYSAVFKHYNDDMYLGTYILPGGETTPRIIPKYERELIAQHPDVNEIFDHKEYSEIDWTVKLKTAPIRIGGVRKSYGNHVLLIGDAAGLVDPMTGEGIHTAMISGKIAAKYVIEMFKEGDFSEESGKAYHAAWMREFGWDFLASEYGAKLIHKFPIVLDAMARLGQKQGQQFLDVFGEVMTGVKSKAEFLKPNISIPIAIALIQEVYFQKIAGHTSRIPDMARALLDKTKEDDKQKKIRKEKK